jgi:hypothetical protein
MVGDIGGASAGGKINSASAGLSIIVTDAIVTGATEVVAMTG